MKNEPLKLGLILASISLVVALLLSVANMFTKDLILETNLKNTKAALAKILPADEYREIDIKDKGLEILGAYVAVKEGKSIGLCFKSSPKGYGGPIVTLVGISSEKTVSGVDIVEMKETPGLGSLANEDKFKNQFLNKKEAQKVVKDGGEIEALTGATITSRAVTNAVNISLDAFDKLKEELSK